MTDTTVAPRDFSFVTPEDWYCIRVFEPKERKQDVDRLVDLLTRSRPDRDSLAPQVRGFLEAAIDAYADRTTVEIYLSMLRMESIPIGCALVVNVLPPTPLDAASTRAAFIATAAGSSGQSGAIEVEGAPVPWARRRTRADIDGTHRYDTEVVQYHYTIPGSAGAVMLSFSTPQIALVDPLRAVFDAVAHSFRWVW